MKRFLPLVFLLSLLCASLPAQKVIVDVPSDFEGEGNLNTAIQNAIDAGTLSNTIFRLEALGYYVLTSTIVVPEGEQLEIIAPEPGTTQETAPPQILWSASGGITTDFNFQCFGDVTLRNVWLRYADVNGLQVGSSFQVEDDPDPAEQEKAVFEGVIFDYSPCPPNSSGAVGVTADHFVGVFKNCYFRNCIDTHLRYYGRALSFPYETSGWHIDSVLFENTTFANMGYVYMQEGAEYGDNVHFNHCTFLNIAMFSLESGWWYKMYVTNSIFVNPFMYGDIPAQTYDENGEGDPNGSVFRIDHADSFAFEAPFTDQDRRILFTNSSHFYEAWLVDWMQNNPYSKDLHQQRRDDEIPVPQPMLSPETLVFFDSTDTDGNKAYPCINLADLYDGEDPGFLMPPTNTDSLKIWLLYKWSTGEDTNWAYQPDAGWYQIWPLPENLSYTNQTLMTAGMGDFPLGDLYHWWPEKYQQWVSQKDQEYDRINTWLETGQDPEDPNGIFKTGNNIPSGFMLLQNYPNPFNPMTQIEYSVPHSADVTLKVYNLLGQEVATLFEGPHEAGKYVATFSGANLASGIYLYRLQSGNVSLTKKFVLMK